MEVSVSYDGTVDEPSAGSRRGAYDKGVRRRREILDRAIEVFAARGAEGTSLRAIGEAIGVSHAALKHYFASREELLIEVYRAAEERSIVEDPPPPEATVVGLMTHAARRNHGVPGLVQLYSTLVAGRWRRGASRPGRSSPSGSPSSGGCWPSGSRRSRRPGGSAPTSRRRWRRR